MPVVRQIMSRMPVMAVTPLSLAASLTVGRLPINSLSRVMTGRNGLDSECPALFSLPPGRSPARRSTNTSFYTAKNGTIRPSTAANNKNQRPASRYTDCSLSSLSEHCPPRMSCGRSPSWLDRRGFCRLRYLSLHHPVKFASHPELERQPKLTPIPISGNGNMDTERFLKETQPSTTE